MAEGELVIINDRKAFYERLVDSHAHADSACLLILCPKKPGERDCQATNASRSLAAPRDLVKSPCNLVVLCAFGKDPWSTH